MGDENRKSNRPRLSPTGVVEIEAIKMLRRTVISLVLVLCGLGPAVYGQQGKRGTVSNDAARRNCSLSPFYSHDHAILRANYTIVKSVFRGPIPACHNEDTPCFFGAICGSGPTLTLSSLSARDVAYIGDWRFASRGPQRRFRIPSALCKFHFRGQRIQMSGFLVRWCDRPRTSCQLGFRSWGSTGGKTWFLRPASSWSPRPGAGPPPDVGHKYGVQA